MGYDLTFDGPQTRTLLELRGDRAVLEQIAPGLLPPWPTRPSSASRLSERLLLWLGPDRWLLLAPLDQEDELEDALCQCHVAEAGVTLVSDTLGFFTLSGRDAEVAISIACPLDLRPDAFGHDWIAMTDAFGVQALTMKSGPHWILAVEPSHAAYVATQLRQII
jgi:heterotetrameric sarcosine oxidase gamma subunit